MNFRATVWKTTRIVGISLALVALLIFATGVVSDWNHQGPSDDAHCPYCHLGHQTPVQLQVGAVGVIAEAGRILGSASGRGLRHGPSLLPDFPTCSSRRLSNRQGRNHPDSACRGPFCGQQHSILAIALAPRRDPRRIGCDSYELL